jgi:hypothetical protein
MPPTTGSQRGNWLHLLQQKKNRLLVTVEQDAVDELEGATVDRHGYR